MKVKDLIADLQEYKPDDEILVAYWHEADIADACDCSRDSAKKAINELEFEYDWGGDSDLLFSVARDFEQNNDCNQETPPVYDLEWEESPK